MFTDVRAFDPLTTLSDRYKAIEVADALEQARNDDELDCNARPCWRISPGR